MNLTELFKEFKGDCDTLVETGTYNGAGVCAALSAGFKSVVSFEINNKLCMSARNKFMDTDGVGIIHDSSSGGFFNGVVNDLNHKALFWLDAHKMGPGGKIPEDYPLKAELEAIGKATIKHTVLIDDVRLFGRYGVDIPFIIKTLDISEEQIKYRTIRDRYPNDVMCIERG